MDLLRRLPTSPSDQATALSGPRALVTRLPLEPLGYTADRYTGAERELARMRGASPGARDGLVRAVAAVLDRDPAAVAALRAELAARLG